MEGCGFVPLVTMAKVASAVFGYVALMIQKNGHRSRIRLAGLQVRQHKVHATDVVYLGIHRIGRVAPDSRGNDAASHGSSSHELAPDRYQHLPQSRLTVNYR